MKLDEWNIRKYKRREKRIKTRSKITSILASGPTDANSPSSASNSSASRGSSTSTESDATLDLNSSKVPFNNCSQQFTSEITHQDTLESGPFSLQTSMPIPDNLADDAHDLGPIVNSSWMFFSSGTDSKSLRLLAKRPGMAPIAIEILFRNWKPGGEYMRYALRFLADKHYCQTLMSVSLTRWTTQDQTLFDLLYFNVRPTDPEKYILLTKALLKADMAFGNRKLEAMSATWAPIWRSAIRATQWKAAFTYLIELKVHLSLRKIDGVLFRCAVAVVAEEILKTKRITLANWKGDEEPFPERTREQYMEIVKDCRDMQIGLDPALQQNMRISWVP
jgi:hypothetical protein